MSAAARLPFHSRQFQITAVDSRYHATSGKSTPVLTAGRTPVDFLFNTCRQ